MQEKLELQEIENLGSYSEEPETEITAPTKRNGVVTIQVIICVLFLLSVIALKFFAKEEYEKFSNKYEALLYGEEEKNDNTVSSDIIQMETG